MWISEDGNKLVNIRTGPTGVHEKQLTKETNGLGLAAISAVELDDGEGDGEGEGEGEGEGTEAEKQYPGREGCAGHVVMAALAFMQR